MQKLSIINGIKNIDAIKAVLVLAVNKSRIAKFGFKTCLIFCNLKLAASTLIKNGHSFNLLG
tara:strand:- start:1268 stop:1453 length:186 start_codon:yes stop_codon:yes gene_type:complete